MNLEISNLMGLPAHPLIVHGVVVLVPLAALGLLLSALGGTTGSYVTGQLFAHFDGARAFYLLLAPMAMLLVSMALLHRAVSRRQALPHPA